MQNPLRIIRNHLIYLTEKYDAKKKNGTKGKFIKRWQGYEKD